MAIVFTDQGKDITTARLKGLGSEPNNIGWGTGAGTAAITDTTLFAEAAEARVAGTSSQQTTNKTNDTYQVVGTMTNNQGAATKGITNVGLCDTAKAAGAAIPAGTKWLMKSDFPVVNLADTDSIQFTLKVVYS